MKEADYINTSNLVRIRQINDLVRGLLILEENETDEQLIKAIAIGVSELEERFYKLIKVK